MPPPAPIAEELQAARTGCVRVDLSGREQLRLTGPDRVSYLQGMVTNDVEALAEGHACYAAVLTAKGAMVGDVRVLKRADELVLDTGEGRGAAVLEFLNRYLISEDAELSAAADLAVLGLLGPQAKAAEARLPAALVLGAFEGFLPGEVDVLVPRERLAEAVAALGEVPVLSAATAEVLRVEAGVPRFGVDMTETTIPLEANLDHAIHYKKGCYIGQEVIARATYRGQMNKRLMGLLLGETAAEPGTELRVGDRKVGWLTSVVRSAGLGQLVALGYVHRDFLEPGTAVELASGGAATVAKLPLLAAGQEPGAQSA